VWIASKKEMMKYIMMKIVVVFQKVVRKALKLGIVGKKKRKKEGLEYNKEFKTANNKIIVL